MTAEIIEFPLNPKPAPIVSRFDIGDRVMVCNAISRHSGAVGWVVNRGILSGGALVCLVYVKGVKVWMAEHHLEHAACRPPGQDARPCDSEPA